MLYGIPDDWIERYQEKMYSAIDPVIQLCLYTEVATSWQEAYLNL